ncbi:MAG TPA: glycosyltransferase [Chitinophagaceae bacterium]|nr:glycosyltransferase [Chitinophagaceae bacterium]
MMKVLWLTSWYPNKLDATNGDFIQRHARAASLFCNVHVIHLEADKNNVLANKTEVSVTVQNNLVEEIVLYKLSRIPLAGKLFSYHRYLLLFKKHIKAYIKQYGKPAIVHVHVPMKAGILALWVKKKFGIPYIVTEHWAIYNNEAPDAFKNRSFLFKSYTRKILCGAALFTPVSHELGKAVQQLVAPVRYTVIPNVADTVLFNYAGRNAQRWSRFTFLHASTLGYQKNPGAILRAYQRLCALYPGALLIMAGYADALPRYAVELGIPPGNIAFTGFVPYEEVAVLMKKSDAFVMFSHYENLPCVITEALCCGLPVISTNVGGIPEVIDTSNGILVNPGDEDALFKAMTEVYANKERFNNSIISGKATAQFSSHMVGGQINEAYKSVRNN